MVGMCGSCELEADGHHMAAARKQREMNLRLPSLSYQRETPAYRKALTTLGAGLPVSIIPF